MYRLGAYISLTVLMLFAGVGQGAQEDTPAERYFSLLRESPGNSYLFDRFYNTWLDTRTVEQLESFLNTNLEQSKDQAGRLLLAFFYERQGRDNEALALYRGVTAQATVSAEFLYYRARAEARNLAFDKAIADLLKARALPCPEEIADRIAQLLGELYIRTNQQGKAAALWKELLAQGQENEGLYEDLIELQIKEGLFDEALQTSAELIALTKDEYKAVMRRLRQGDIYQYKADTQKALAVYAETLEMVGQDSWLENQVCAQIEEIFLREDDTQGLRDYLTELVKAFPQRLSLKRRLANLLIHLDQTDQALDLFQEILEVTPGDKAHQQAYVKVLIEAGQLKRAIHLLEQVRAAHPQDHELMITLAELYHQTDQPERVATTLQRFLELSDKTEQVYLRVGGLFEQYGLRAQAAAVYAQMIEALPESLTARQVYAEFLYRDKQQERALALFAEIARRGDLQTLMRACNAAGTRGHDDQALAWAEARYDAFSSDATYLNHLCKLAIRLEQFDKALEWARQQLDLATAYPAIRSAISQALAAQGSTPRARQLIRELQARSDLSIQQICLLSELLETQGLPAQADAVLARAQKVNPLIALRQQAHIYGLRRDWIQAARSMESLISQAGRRPDLIRDLIGLYEKSGQYEEALKWVQVWEKVSPASAAPRQRHARLLHDLGRNDEAIKILDSAGREFAGDAEVLLDQAKLYAATGQADEAQRIYWRLYENADNTTEKLRYMRSLAEVAGQLGKRAQVVERLRRQALANRTAVVPLLALAEVYKQMGKYEERRQALLEATRLKTDDIELIYELASVEEAQGDWRKAIETLRRAITLDTSNETRLRMARLMIQHGNTEEGFGILMEMAGGDKMDPRDAEAIAGMIMSTGMWDSAIRLLQPLMSLHPRDYKLHYQYGTALEMAGRSGDALEVFVDLLGFSHEIPGNTAQAKRFSWQWQGMDTNLQQVFPAEAVELLRLSQVHARVYQPRRGRWSSGHPSSGMPANLALPPVIGELQAYVLCHILTLAGDMGPQDRSRLRSDLYRSGIRDIAVLMTIAEHGLGDLQRAIDELAADYPDDRTIQAVWILHRIEGRGCTIAEAKRIFDMFEKTHPRLAVTIGLRCYGPDPVAARLFAQAFRMLQALPEPGYYEVMSISFILGNEKNYAKLTGAQRRLLDQYLIKWYAKLKNNLHYRVRIFYHVATLLAQRPNLRDFVRFLEDEVSSQPSASSSGRPPRSDRPLIGHLSCPPQTLPDFPDHVVKVLQGASDHSAGFFAREDPLDPTRLGKVLDQVQEPILRILMATLSGRHDKAEAVTRALLEQDQTCLAAYLLGGSLAGIQGKAQEVIALLGRARSLPMSPYYAQLIDGALVASALELDQAAHASEVNTGKQAAIRLLSRRINPPHREELLVATEQLGLTEQAANLRAQIVAASQNTNAPGPGNTLAYASPVNVNLVETLLKKGKTESALRLVLSHLRGMAAGSLFPNAAPFTPSPAPRLQKLLNRYKVVDELIALARPPAQAPVQGLAQYGRICEILGRKRKAMAAYERAVAQDPSRPAAGLQLAILLAEEAQERAAGHLAAIDKVYANQVGQALGTVIQMCFGRGQADQAVSLVTVLMNYLDRIHDPALMNLDWVDRVGDILAQSYHHDSYRLDHLYQKQASHKTADQHRQQILKQIMKFPGPPPRMVRRMMQDIGQYSSAEAIRLSKQRREIHNQLCRKMLAIPQLAEAGFSRLAAEAKARGALTDEHMALARQAMLTHEPHQKMGHRFGISRRIVNGRYIRPISSAECLALQAYQTRTCDRLISEFLPELEQKQKTEQAAKLGHFLDLYTVAADDFFRTGERFLDSVTPNRLGSAQAMFEAEVGIEIVLDAYQARDLQRDQAMGQFILSRIEGDVKQGWFVHQEAAKYWFDYLLAKDRALAKLFLDSVLALYDSPRGRRSGLARRFERYSQRLEDSRGKTGPNLQFRLQTLSPPPSAQPGPAGTPRNRTLRSRGSRTNRRRK